MAATAPKISAIGLEPRWPAAPVGAPCAAVFVLEAPVEAGLVALVVAESDAVETVLLLLPVEAAERDVTEAVLLPTTVVNERTDWLSEADALDEADADAEAAEEAADRLPPVIENGPK